MNADSHAPRILGIAFVLQAITSWLSGVILKVALIVSGNISESMVRIANHTGLMRANIFGEMAHGGGSHLPRSHSFAVYLPYLPFEFVVGVWFLVRSGRR